MLLSLAMMLLCGLLASRLFQKFKLPGLLGLILLGILMGPYVSGFLDEKLLLISNEVRLIALIVILLRAGLGLNLEILKKVGFTALKMSAIPCLLEGFAVTYTAHYWFGLPFFEAGMLGFIIAAVSPAVIVPSMLELKNRGLGMGSGVPIIVLAGASVDDVFAITLFSVFLGMGTGSGGSSLLQLGMIPVEIAASILLGYIAGLLLVKFFDRFAHQLNGMEELMVLTAAAIAIKVLGDYVNAAGLLSVMTVGFVLLAKKENTAYYLEGRLSKVWAVAQIFLFILIGSAVNIQVALEAGLMGLIIIAVGLTFRSLGVFISTFGSFLSLKERLFCIISYLPKATVQAAIGGIPLAAGVPSGELILAVAVLSILITAPLGAIAIKLSAPLLLEHHEENSASNELG
ncbi:cation:proton antiporter domain-containing protein [Candidatus Contubernalis alkaliaceticus]|uniref:cation:proton antiporter domain-containing protein n=1 Tax=Candidatus Contubernalis alkaliaceticus TaxID=338645 RepID=UPI001F4C164F|nr:cation:proton antiporter [Candidatus Contubernalis alkalaceticus]UNC90665.1 cation:proton antiporter [Candidatus Contubernalis alkalaceticus]